MRVYHHVTMAAAAATCLMWPLPVSAGNDAANTQFLGVFSNLVRDNYFQIPNEAAMADAVVSEARRRAGINASEFDTCMLGNTRGRNLATAMDAAYLCMHLDDATADVANSATDALVSAALTPLEGRNRFFSREEVKRLSNGISRVGIGLSFSDDPLGARIVSLVREGPALEAGLAVGDVIVAVDGLATRQLSQEKVADSMRGKFGTTVILQIVGQNGQQRTVKVMRRVILTVNEAIDFERRGDVFIISLHEFTKGSAVEFSRLVRTYGSDAKLLVVDLRDNVGGLLDEAIAVADAMLKKGNIAKISSRNEAESIRYSAKSDTIVNGKSIVLLTSKHTASGAEIVAAAIQDNHTGMVVGATSSGIGYIDSMIRFDRGTALRLTTGQIYRANGERLQGHPVIPTCAIHEDFPALVDIVVHLAQVGQSVCSPNAG